MLATPLLHKPVSYGSQFLDWAFVAGISLHATSGLLALIFGLLAVSVRKGSPRHLRFGNHFILAMKWVALTGIVLDTVRLSFHVEENHTKYFDYAMPSSYPARFAFLFAGVCVLQLIRQGGPRVVLSRTEPGFGCLDRATTIVLFSAGLGLSGLIFARYNPWTGALWMIWTFMVLLIFVPADKRYPGWQVRKVAMHRFCMLFLISFCGWGAVQGFSPAIILSLYGVDNSTTVYTGNQPGHYRPAFWFFLAGWAPFFLVGSFFVRRFSRAHSPNRWK